MGCPGGDEEREREREGWVGRVGGGWGGVGRVRAQELCESRGGRPGLPR